MIGSLMHVILTTVGNLVDLPKKTTQNSGHSWSRLVTNKRSLVCNLVAIIGLT